jgi:hypothetical protein
MIYRDILYPPLLSKLEVLISDVEQELENGEDEHLNNAFQIFDNFKDLITNGSLEAIDNNFPVGDLLISLDELANIALLKNKILEFKAFLKIVLTIQGEGEFNIDDEMQLSLENFRLRKYSGNEIPFNIYAFFNTDSPKNSIGFIIPGEEYSSTDINESGFSLELLLAMYKFLSEQQDLDINSAYIIYSNEAYSQNAAQSALKLLAVISGKSVHKELTMTAIPAANSIKLKIVTGHPYHQFEESLVILSEFNQQQGILNKFMCIYHIIEGFMIKAPLVLLNRQNGGNLFSIRDFKRLFDRLKTNELEALKDLFSKQELGDLWSFDIEPNRFEILVQNGLNNLENDLKFQTVELDSFLMHLGIYNQNGLTQLKTNISAKVFVTALYKVRCAIVHNKETEHHLSHFNLNYSVALFVQKVMIEPLFLLISELIASHNDAIWYSNSEIQLFERAS